MHSKTPYDGQSKYDTMRETNLTGMKPSEDAEFGFFHTLYNKILISIQIHYAFLIESIWFPTKNKGPKSIG